MLAALLRTPSARQQARLQTASQARSQVANLPASIVRAGTFVWDTMQTGADSARDTVKAYSNGVLDNVKVFNGMARQTVEDSQRKGKQTR